MIEISKFLAGLKENVLQKKLAIYLKKREKAKSNFSLKKIKTVLAVAILPENTQANVFQNQIQKEIASCLHLEKSHIKILLYKEKHPKKPENFTFEFYKNHFNWLGSIGNKSLKNILRTPYDLFVSYNFENNLYLKLCQSFAIHTHFFVGVCKNPNFLYDLSILIPHSDRTLFNEEMKKYLTILKKI